MVHYIPILALCLVHIVVAAQTIQDWLDEQEARSPKRCDSHPEGPLRPREADTTCPLLVDDDTAFERASWHPWTFPPVCVQAQNEIDPKLCLFTYVSLRGETGISMITTSEVAAAGIGVLEDADAKWADWARGHPLVVADPPPYEIKEVEDKGLGVVANRTIRKDEVIMVRHPVLLRMQDSRSWKLQDVMKLLHRGGLQLPLKDRQQMMELAHSKGGYLLDDIMTTNSFGVLLDGVDHMGLFLDVSRINHACKPNLFNRFSSTTLAMEVVAYRDIEPGEELTFSYTPLNLPSKERQDLIREWGFNCTCSLCTSPNDLAVSDHQRDRIQDILAELDSPTTRNRSAVQKRVVEIVDLCKKEGMTAQIGDFYTIIMDIYSSMGDLDMAKRYGLLALEELRHYAGHDHERTEKALAMLEDLNKRLDI
ncbi:SET domain-containing protein [Xylariaceae sp. FL0662B]|nr:SET domain-containing protein [Xylariaceae sp. FL0662B]